MNLAPLILLHAAIIGSGFAVTTLVATLVFFLRNCNHAARRSMPPRPRATERRATERRASERRASERRATECRTTEHSATEHSAHNADRADPVPSAMNIIPDLPGRTRLPLDHWRSSRWQLQ